VRQPADIPPASRLPPWRSPERKVTNMTYGQHLLMAGAMLGALLSADIARAQGGVGPVEKWSCTATKASDQKPQSHAFALQEGMLIAQPLGAPRYQLLDNTPYGIIAVDRAGDLDPLYGFHHIYVATVMIDRKSGHFTTTLSQSGYAPVSETGSCEKLEVKAEPTTGSAVAGKK
jgi:hypothetical protein